jgi:polysaccharide export outer membrane protein
LDLTTADGLFSARNFQLADGDLVYVTESPVTTAQTVLGLLGSVVGLSNNLQ